MIFEPEECPVCGAPGGNCGPTDGSHGGPVGTVTFEEWSEGYRPSAERRPQVGDVVASERIWEDELVPRGNGRTRRVLRYKAGDVIPADAAERLNVDSDGKQSSVPVAEAVSSGAVPLKGGSSGQREGRRASRKAGQPGAD